MKVVDLVNVTLWQRAIRESSQGAVEDRIQWKACRGADAMTLRFVQFLIGRLDDRGKSAASRRHKKYFMFQEANVKHYKTEVQFRRVRACWSSILAPE